MSDAEARLRAGSAADGTAAGSPGGVRGEPWAPPGSWPGGGAAAGPRGWAPPGPDGARGWAPPGSDGAAAGPRGWAPPGSDGARGWAPPGADGARGWAPPGPDGLRGWAPPGADGLRGPAVRPPAARPPAARAPSGPRRSFGLPLGRIGGIAIVVSPSWLISAVVIVVLATPVVRQVVGGISTSGAVAVAALLAVLLGVSVLAHELGHCLAARALGVPVREVRLYLVGGVSELGRSPASPKEEALIAAAGPGVSALLAVVCGLLVGSTGFGTIGWLLLVEMAVANGIVAVFNILPALPLDGGRVLRAGVWRVFRRRRAGTIAAVVGGFAVAIALLVWAVVRAFGGTRESLLLAGIAAVMGIFVAAGAMAEWPSRRVRRWPDDVTLGSLAWPLLQLPGETPVGMALGVAGNRAVVLTGADGIAVGVLDGGLAAQLAERQPSAPASLAAVPVEPGMIVLADDAPEDLVERLSQVSSPYFLLVGEQGHPVGVLLRADVNRVLAGAAVPAGRA